MSALVVVGVGPFGLVFEEKLGIRLPVALKAGGFGGSGSGFTILESGHEDIARNHRELAVIFFYQLVRDRGHAGTVGAAVVGVFYNLDRGVRIAFDVVGDIAVIIASLGDNRGGVAAKINRAIFVLNNLNGEKN